MGPLVDLVSRERRGAGNTKTPTKTTTRHGVFLAELIITLAELFVAENLIGFTDLGWSVAVDNGNETAYGLELFVGGFITGVLIWTRLDGGGPRRTRHTGMGDDGQFAISLLDLELRGRGSDPEGIVVGGISDHRGR